jgi:hypothetical protein
MVSLGVANLVTIPRPDRRTLGQHAQYGFLVAAEATGRLAGPRGAGIVVPAHR